MTHRSIPQDQQNISETENALRLPKSAGSSVRRKKTTRKKAEMKEERHRSRTSASSKRNYNKNSTDTIKLCRKPESRLNYGYEYAVGKTKFKPERCESLRRRRSSRSVCSFSTVVSKISLFFGKLMSHHSTHEGSNKNSRRSASAFESKIPPKILIDSFDTLPMSDLLEPNYGYKPETSQLFSFETINQNTSSVPPDNNENAKKKEKKKKKKKGKSTPSSQDTLSEVKNAVTENATTNSTKANTKQTTQGDKDLEKDIDEKSSSDVRHIPVNELESFKVGSTKLQEVQKNTAINADSKTEAEGKHKHHKYPHQHHEHKHKKDEDEAEVIEGGKNKHHKRTKSSEKQEEARQRNEEHKHKSHTSEVDTSSEETVVKKKGVKSASGRHHKSRVGHKSKKITQGEESADDSTSDISFNEKKNFRAPKDHKRYETDPYDTIEANPRRNITRRRDLIPPGNYASRRRRADLYDNDVYDELDRIFDDRMGSRMRCMNDYGSDCYGRRGPSYDEYNYSPRNDCRFSKSYSMPASSERGCCPELGSVACRCTPASSECHSGRVCTCNCECSSPSKKGNSKLGGELLDTLNEICSEIENRRRADTYICVKQPKPCRTIYAPTVGQCLSPDNFMDDNDYSAYFGSPLRRRYASDYLRGLPPRAPRREYDSDTESRERPKRKSSAAPSSTSSQPPQVPVLTPCPIYYPVPTPSCPPAQPSPAPQVNWCTPAIPAPQPVGVVVKPTPVPVVVPGQCNPVSTYCPPCVIPSSAPQIVQPANVCLPAATYYQRL